MATREHVSDDISRTIPICTGKNLFLTDDMSLHSLFHLSHPKKVGLQWGLNPLHRGVDTGATL